MKKNIESSQGKNLYPAEQQMLIYQGKVLTDDTTISDNNVEEGKFIVIMLKKVYLFSLCAIVILLSSPIMKEIMLCYISMCLFHESYDYAFLVIII